VIDTKPVKHIGMEVVDVDRILVDILPDLDCFVFRVSGAIVCYASCLFLLDCFNAEHAETQSTVDVNRRLH